MDFYHYRTAFPMGKDGMLSATEGFVKEALKFRINFLKKF